MLTGVELCPENKTKSGKLCWYVSANNNDFYKC